MRLIILSLLFPTLTCLAATEERLHKSFPVPPRGRLVVHVDFGEISISTHAGQEVVVDVWRKVTRRSKEEEEAFLKESPVEFNQQGDKVTVESRRQKKESWSWNRRSFRDRTEGSYTIQVPTQFSVSLNTAGGGVSVDNLTGEVSAETSGGGLQFKEIRGPIQGETSGGSIQVTDCEGKIEVDTSGGGITVMGGGGTLKADTSGGGITVREFRGSARVGTSGGGITLENVGGELEGDTSGGPVQAVLTSPLPGDVRLSTSGGEVTVRAPADAAFQLDAVTSAGGVSCKLPIAIVGKTEHGRLRGLVNGGGPTVRLRSSGGSIRVQER